jgi:hypothetical protein
MVWHLAQKADFIDHGERSCAWCVFEKNGPGVQLDCKFQRGFLPIVKEGGS